MRFKRFFSVVLMGVQIAGVLAQLASAQVTRRRPRPGPQVTNMQQGLQIKLSEGVPATEPSVANPRAAAVPLAADEAERVLGRLQPIKTEVSDEQDFALR